MSYITKTTGKLTLVDIQCVNEALKKLGCSNIYISKGGIKFTNTRGISMGYSLKNGALHTTSRDPHYQKLVEFMGQIESKYTEVLKEKQERIRKEQERLAEIARKKRELEKELAKAGAALQSGAKMATNQANDKLVELDNQMKSSQKSLDEAQDFLNQVEKSKKEFVAKTVEEITAKGKEKGWSMSANQVIKKGQANVTRLQLRKKQLN